MDAYLMLSWIANLGTSAGLEVASVASLESLSIQLGPSIPLLAAGNYWLDPQTYWAIARVILGLGLVIFIHELGHFLVAKACGVKCDKFYVGFDAFDIKIGDRVIVPRSLLRFQWGETEYGVGILPLGGYVKMLGQDDNPANHQVEMERVRAGGKISDEESAMAAAGIVDRDQLDPRSFLAKSVLQRMAIISAGVIFNLISAVFFAAIAFKSGVNYTPPVVGKVIGAGPAWEANLGGAEIEQIGQRKFDGYFTWINLAEQFIFNGDKQPLKIRFVPYGETTSKEIELLPRKGLNRAAPDLAMGGISPPVGTMIGDLGVIEGNPAALADPPLQPKDRIVEVNGYPVKTVVDLQHVLLRDADLVAEFVIERATNSADIQPDKQGDPANQVEQIRTSVQPNPSRNVGFGLKWLPISHVRQGSPGDLAGLMVGDEITKVNGRDREDLLSLDKRLILAARNQEKVELEVLRKGQNINLTVQPIVPNLLSTIGDNQPVAIDSLGIAVPLENIIDWVDPQGPAQKSLQTGDQILAVRYALSDAQKSEARYANMSSEPIRLAKEKVSWAEIDSNLQRMESGTEFELTLSRNEQELTVGIATQASKIYFQDMRGIALTGLEAFYQSKSWNDAFQDGAMQVWQDFRKVGKTLVKLVRGEISPTNLGGPGTIAMVATAEASQGNSRLLLFLAFLSANLAIVNLLPIPVLDGGHLLFLAYEGIFRRPVDEKMQVVLSYIGLAMILTLMLFVIALDIGRISSLFM